MLQAAAAASGGGGGRRQWQWSGLTIAPQRTSPLQEQPHGACRRHITDDKASLAANLQRAGRLRCLQSVRAPTTACMSACYHNSHSPAWLAALCRALSRPAQRRWLVGRCKLLDRVVA